MAVQLESELRRVSFYAEVSAAESTGEMNVHYLTKLHDSNLYVWSDEAWLPADHPFIVVMAPSVCRQTHRFPVLIVHAQQIMVTAIKLLACCFIAVVCWI